MQLPPKLNLAPGELVEIRSVEEIAQTLDEHRCCGGLLFMPQMSNLSGRRFRVYKRIKQIVVENGGGVRKLSGTVILQDALCDGGDVECDRSCYFFWREAWLKRVADDGTSNCIGGTAQDHAESSN